MKFNWGYRVALLYLSFAGLIIYLVSRSMSEKIDLVAPDYYAQELKYQDKIESTENNNTLTEPLAVNVNDSGIVITYPKDLKRDVIAGNILLFRPSDKTKDINVPVNAGSRFIQVIGTEQLLSGMYIVKVDYSAAGKKYYSEKQVIIP